jgi:diacylglycerol kinase
MLNTIQTIGDYAGAIAVCMVLAIIATTLIAMFILVLITAIEAVIDYAKSTFSNRKKRGG